MAVDLTSLRFPDSVPTLIGPEVTLRELSEHDIPAWFARATDAESADLAGDPIPESIEAGAAWLQRHRDRFRERAAIRWAICTPGSNDSIGTVGLIIASREERVAELGIVVARASWGRGFGAAAARTAARYAFDTLGLREIRAEVLQRNAASLRLLEKTGFRRLQCVPEGASAGADPEACFLYGLLASEVRDAVQVKLEPLTARHAGEMFAVLRDPAIYEFENEPPASPEALAARYRRLEARRSPDGTQQWLNWIIRLPSGEAAGYVQATVMPSGAAYVAYELASRHWRRGIGSAAVRAMLDELRANHGVTLFVAVLKARNFRSLALLRKLGFEAASDAQRGQFGGADDEQVMVMRPHC
jgi:RimJ/RimL family protein N-acetyltransferase